MASAGTWEVSLVPTQSAGCGRRQSDAAIDCGARISVHHRRRIHQASTREIESVVVRGSTRKAFRSRPTSRSFIARASISREIQHSPRRAPRSHQPGTTSSPAATPMAPSSRTAMRRVEGGRAMATVEPWWGITIAAAGAAAIPGILPIRRAGARRRRCAPRLATDSSTASPRIRARTGRGIDGLPGRPGQLRRARQP